MCKDSSVRVEGAVLVGRKDGEFWFVDSVFRHGADFFGCTGSTVVPVSEEQAEDAMLTENLEERYEDFWRERAEEVIQADCKNCVCGPDEDGCDDCGYLSLRDFCEDIARNDGYDAVFDYPGYAYEEALRALPELADDIETVDHTGGGRIFGREGLDDFDEVYNPAALEACLAFESGIISYDDAVRIIFNK